MWNSSHKKLNHCLSMYQSGRNISPWPHMIQPDPRFWTGCFLLKCISACKAHQTWLCSVFAVDRRPNADTMLLPGSLLCQIQHILNVSFSRLTFHKWFSWTPTGYCICRGPRENTSWYLVLLVLTAAESVCMGLSQQTHLDNNRYMTYILYCSTCQHASI